MLKQFARQTQCSIVMKLLTPETQIRTTPSATDGAWLNEKYILQTWKEEEKPYVRRAQEHVMSQQSTADVLPISNRIKEETDRSLFTLMLSYRKENIDLTWIISQSTTRLCVREMLSVCTNSPRAALILNINFYISASARWQTAAAPQQAFLWPQLPTEPHIIAGPARSQPCQAPKKPSHSLPHDKACGCGVCVCVLGYGWVSLTGWLAAREGRGVFVPTSFWLTVSQK